MTEYNKRDRRWNSLPESTNIEGNKTVYQSFPFLAIIRGVVNTSMVLAIPFQSLEILETASILLKFCMSSNQPKHGQVVFTLPMDNPYRFDRLILAIKCLSTIDIRSIEPLGSYNWCTYSLGGEKFECSLQWKDKSTRCRSSVRSVTGFVKLQIHSKFQ